MSVNLSRRSQSLVERQLRLIESLEYGEQDQQRLANLSRLNRIAMRIHRNSQNLLVLAGQEPVNNWNQPVTLAHLVEAALAEIEDYERVSFEVQPDIALRGPAVHDAVHLLVELIDNATSFSAAEMPVHITGRILTTGGALVDITDRGIGMPAKEMAYANQQLDNPPPPGIDVPKWMGLLVVARLASRHGIRVRLNPAELGGLTALVWLPDEILTHYAGPADPGRVVAEQRGAAVGATAFAAARMNMPAVRLAARPDPAWSAPVPQAVPAEPLAAARLAASRPARRHRSGTSAWSCQTRRARPVCTWPPIFDEVESRWSRSSHEAPGLTRPAHVIQPGLRHPAWPRHPAQSRHPARCGIWSGRPAPPRHGPRPGRGSPPRHGTRPGCVTRPVRRLPRPYRPARPRHPTRPHHPARSTSPGPITAPGPLASPGPVVSPGPASADPDVVRPGGTRVAQAPVARGCWPQRRAWRRPAHRTGPAPRPATRAPESSAVAARAGPGPPMK